MSDFKETFAFQGGSISVTIQRPCNYNAVEDFKWIPIENEAYFLVAKYFSDDHFFLPKLYAALTYVTGSGDSGYDDFKGSYNFDFDLDVQKNGKSSAYRYYISHYRSYINFSLYHRVPKNDPRDPKYMSQPDDDLFSDANISGFSYFFCKFLLKSVEDAQYKPKPFVKCSDSNLLLFGFLKGEYFSESYTDYKQYEKEKEQKELEVVKSVE